MTAEIVIRLPDLIVEFIDNKIKLGESVSYTHLTLPTN